MNQFGRSTLLAALLLVIITIQTRAKDHFTDCLEEEICIKFNGKIKFEECTVKLHKIDSNTIMDYALKWFQEEKMLDKSVETLTWKMAIDIGCNNIIKTRKLIDDYYNTKVEENQKAHDQRAEFRTRSCSLEMVNRCLLEKSFSSFTGK